MKKSLSAAFLGLVLAVMTATPALALHKVCISIYHEDELCERYCEFYSGGEQVGSIYENYGC